MTFTNRARSFGIGLVGLALALALWQLLAATRFLNPLSIPSMELAFRNIGALLRTRHLWAGVGETLEGMMLGFVIGSVAGILVGTVVGLNKYAYASCFLLIEFCRTVPVIAVLPLAVLLFGASLKMKVLLIVFGGFFPTVIQTTYGVRNVDPVISDTARIFGVSRLRRFTSVTMPSAAPFIATGLRLGATGALLLDIVAEIVAGGSGIGLQILQAEAAGAVAYTYALLIITGAIGMVLVMVVTAVERRVMSWHEVYRVR